MAALATIATIATVDHTLANGHPLPTLPMNFITILLTALMGTFSVVGAVPDRVIRQAILDQLAGADTLAVRVDMASPLQLLQGNVDQIRIAGQGLYPYEAIRIESVDVETDRLDIDIAALRQGQIQLERSLDAAVNIVLTQADLNRALQSPLVTELLQGISSGLLGNTVGQIDQATVIQPQLTILPDNRLRLEATLQHATTGEQLVVDVTTGIAIAAGTRLQLIEPQITANDIPFPMAVVEPVLDGFSQQYSLAQLEPQGITARILRLQTRGDRITLTGFARITPSALKD